MARKALGLIETMGLAAAYGAADAALKAADVSLIGLDFAGNGGTTVKIEGEVAAVNSAVQAGVAAAEKIYIVLAKYVIAKPGDEIDPIIHIKTGKTQKGKAPAKESGKKNKESNN